MRITRRRRGPGCGGAGVFNQNLPCWQRNRQPHDPAPVHGWGATPAFKQLLLSPGYRRRTRYRRRISNSCAMSYDTLYFALFLAVTWAAFALLPWRGYVLLLASIAFYAVAGLRDSLLAATVILVNYA